MRLRYKQKMPCAILGEDTTLLGIGDYNLRNKKHYSHALYTATVIQTPVTYTVNQLFFIMTTLLVSLQQRNSLD